MTSKKLSSKRIFAVCRTQLYQMRLLLILFGLVIAVIPTLYCLGELSNWYRAQYDLQYIKEFIMATIAIGGFAPMFGLGMGMAVMQFGYLHKRQKLDYFHAVPVLRSEHYLGRVLAAFIALVSAAALVALGQVFSVMVTVGFAGDGLVRFILWRCFWTVLPAFSAYLFTVLMIVLTATLWETVFSLLVISALSPAICLFAYVLVNSSMPICDLPDVWDMISPFSPLIFCVYYMAELFQLELLLSFSYEVAIGLAHVILCGALSMWCFCRRRSELAESNSPTKFKLIVRFSAAFCASAFGSVVLLWITGDYIAYWFGAVIGLIAAWLIMELLYARSIRKAMGALWVNLLGFAVIILINILVMFGFIGLPDIPKAEDVYAVSVGYGKETMNADGSSSYEDFHGNFEQVYTDDGQRTVSMGTWDTAEIGAGVELANALLENQKDLYFPYIPRQWGGYSRYGTSYTLEDEEDQLITYDITVELYTDGGAQRLSFGDVSGSGCIEELYDCAREITETEEYRLSNPSLVMMDELTHVQYVNYDVSGEPEQYLLSGKEDPEAFIQRLKEAYLEDMYSHSKGGEYVDYKEYGPASTEIVTMEKAEAAVPISITDEYTLFLDPEAEIVLEGGILDDMYPAEGFACRLSPVYTKAFDKNTNYWTDSTSIYLYRADYPRACAVLDELRAEQTAEQTIE